jgi:hypothetical protein
MRIGARAPACEELVKVASELRVPLRVETILNAEVSHLYEQKLVLVRPDGHIAWRSDREPQDCRALVDCIRGAGPLRPAQALEVAS